MGRGWVERLAASECPALTTRRRRRAENTGASHDPIVWAEARGINVVDTDGNRYVDLTSGFGVSFIGHGHPAVVEAIRRQAETLLHALGDLHPSSAKIELLERLCALGPWDEARAMVSLGGADAITAALKTAVLATGRPGVIAFEGSYHGLSYGPLAVSGFSDRFRRPFEAQLGRHAHFTPWPETDLALGDALQRLPNDWSDIGAVIIEPVQGRGGVRLPPNGFLSALGRMCKEHGAVLIVDEIFTGLGRCGAWWRSVDEGLTPDLICSGKALGGGMPVSACLGRLEVMQAWGNPDRKAIHTGTFFGDPVGAAAALATLEIIEREGLVSRARELGDQYARALRNAAFDGVVEVRGAGLMLGIELEGELRALKVARALLDRGYLVLPAGPLANVVQLSPPATLEADHFDRFTEALGASLKATQ